MVLKLDMSQAYDRVEWVFLERIMLALGFDRRWVSLTMKCVSTVTYSVFINREPKGSFSPSRGLRQGYLARDPLIFFSFVQKVSHLYFTRWKMKVRTKELRLVDTVQECNVYSLQTTAFCLLERLYNLSLPWLIFLGSMGRHQGSV